MAGADGGTNDAQPQKFSQGLKVFVGVVLVLAAQTGAHAFTVSLDWTKFTEAGEIYRVFIASIDGTIYGAMQGTLRAVQVVTIMWMGPSLWGQVAPVLAGAAQFVSSAAQGVLSLFRRAPKNPAST